MASAIRLFSDDFHLSSPAGISFVFGIILSFIVLRGISIAIYNLFFHPLAHIPGSLSSRASGIPASLRLRNGTIIPWIQKLHDTHGDVVRIAPNEVSFISGETAWQDIYGFHTGKNKKGAYLKDRSWFPVPVNKTYSLLVADEASHSRMRRSLSHAFSAKALREQEPLIQSSVDLLVRCLHEQVQDGAPVVDIIRWYNFTNFDIITDLTFGEPLYCLRDKDYHPWVNLIFASAKAAGFLATRRRYAMFDYYDRAKDIFVDHAAVLRMREEFFGRSKQKVTERLEQGGTRNDFISYILKNEGIGEKALSKGEMVSNAILLLSAGSETTATLLSGATYLLLAYPQTYKKLVEEVRGRFKTQAEITIDEVNKMDYLIACLQESLRYYPPVPTGFPRAVPAGGDRISGRYIPGGTSVYMSQHAANHSSRNFKDPDLFVPERWLGDERYRDDNKACMNAFSFGPRNCLGKNLAYAQLRLILAKVIFNFDLELMDESKEWIKDQKLFTLWEKPPLKVKLHAVQQ